MLEIFDLIAQDGTRLNAWKSGPEDGMPVLVCNGMGVPPEAWPRLLDDSCEFSVAGWNHRGALGSDRPDDETRIDIEDHTDDALALMDSMGWERAVIVAWSLGVNVAFELAGRHPERVSGILSVAGVPGGTFDTLFAPQFVPKQLRKPMGVGVAQIGKTFGSQLNLLAKVVPTGRPFAEVLRHTGFMLPHARTDDVVPWVNSMLDQDFNWYFELALALARHEEVDPSFIQCPVTVVSGAIDMLTSQADVQRYADKIAQAEVHSLPGTHCLPLEFPDAIMEMLRDLYARVAWEESLSEARKEAGIKPPVVHEALAAEEEQPPQLEDELQTAERPDFFG